MAKAVKAVEQKVQVNRFVMKVSVIGNDRDRWIVKG